MSKKAFAMALIEVFLDPSYDPALHGSQLDPRRLSRLSGNKSFDLVVPVRSIGFDHRLWKGIAEAESYEVNRTWQAPVRKPRTLSLFERRHLAMLQLFRRHRRGRRRYEDADATFWWKLGT
ncbi:hypothetical protein OP10G_1834 [Fimbriimonas ginsengisoli Gsoil 348]|uniref:Uncharacterized protein n=1 Tax=Fimbriimonas ginsengisoli Gsoil 348 TaxID=661478 RepID=A0A068NPA3_FIMGI|nr:hypothetical protein OP10G_1834 [Fimbriimonas ginsengisoli Gsoil 348]